MSTHAEIRERAEESLAKIESVEVMTLGADVLQLLAENEWLHARLAEGEQLVREGVDEVGRLAAQRDALVAALSGWVAQYGQWVQPNTTGVDLLKISIATLREATK